MPGKAGTIEVVAQQLGLALQPLEQQLKPESFLELLAELGLRLPPAALQPALLGALNAGSGAAGALRSALTQLTADIAADNEIGIATSGVSALAQIKNLIGALNPIGTALRAAAGGLPGTNAAEVASFANELPKNLLGHLVIGRLEGTLPSLVGLASLLGIIDYLPSLGVARDPTHPAFVSKRLQLQNLGKALSAPKDLLQARFKWGAPDFDGALLLPRLSDALSLFAMYASVDNPEAPRFIDAGMFTISVDKPPALRLRLQYGVPANFDVRLPLTKVWSLRLQSRGSFAAGLEATASPPANLSIKPAAGTKPEALAVSLVARNPSPIVILGQTGGSRFQAESITFEAGLEVSGDGATLTAQPRVRLAIGGGKVVIDTGAADGFIGKILSGLKLESDCDLDLDFSLDRGLRFGTSSGLETQLASHVELGPVAVDAVTLRIGIEDGKFPIGVTADLRTTFGPLDAVVQRLGFEVVVTLADNNDGNLGPLNLALGFKPPTGVGLSLDVGIIKGGGFLSINVDKGEYAGAMELDFLGIISLKAIGIINTKMPDGSSGFSLLVIITADFPPIQLGFGFTLNAVGGLVGLSRTVNIEALREGVRTNAIKSVLFPQDVIANITRIVSDLKQIFPPLAERFIVGPMAELGWGTPSIITLELGILLEIPVPRIAILGVLGAFLPAEELALLRIQVNFLGVIDFENKYISFDASLFDSRLLIYTLTGDMAFRLSWGDNPMFVLSVGGFHPAYHDAPQDLQHMTRLGISLLSGDNPRISVLSYFAVTSNTVQFGARAELYAEAAGFNVYGFIGYDVLFQFDPFKFIASFEAGLALREGTDTIMGIHLAGQLSGINPWNARGDASITILFVPISVSFNETWGDSATKIDPPKEDIVARLTTEINDNRNWRAEIPDSNNLHVSIRKIELPPDQLVIHPMGVLTFSERLVPLGLDITKFGNKVPLDAKRFDIKATDPGILTQTVTEEFAPANFFDKNDNEKLSSPSFERLTSGFKVTGASSLVMPTAVNKSVEYELTYLHKKRTQRTRAGKYRMAKHAFKASTKASAAAVSTLSYARNRISVNAPDTVAVAPPQYAVANVSDMRLAGPDLVASSYTEASQKYSALIARRPELKEQVQILAHHELNED
jgi:hypothetical protein